MLTRNTPRRRAVAEAEGEVVIRHGVVERGIHRDRGIRRSRRGGRAGGDEREVRGEGPVAGRVADAHDERREEEREGGEHRVWKRLCFQCVRQRSADDAPGAASAELIVVWRQPKPQA